MHPRHMALAVTLPLLSGCLFPGAIRQSDLIALETQIQTVSQRVDALETGTVSASVAASAAGTSAAFGTTSTAAAGAGGSGANAWPLLAFSWGGAMRKLVRGLTNLVTGWVEVPKRINETTLQSGPFAGFTWGLLRGAGHGFIRTAGGAYETITFPFPAPPGYHPIMRPTYVFTEDDEGES